MRSSSTPGLARAEVDELEQGSDDHVGGQEEEDDRLDDVHDLDRDAGVDLHQSRSGTHHPEEQGGGHDAEGVGAPKQRYGDGIEADRAAEGCAHACG